MEHTTPRRQRPWLLVVPTVADIHERDATLQSSSIFKSCYSSADLYSPELMEMHQEAVNGLERIKYYTADYSYPSFVIFSFLPFSII
jgi:hypothetical protein